MKKSLASLLLVFAGFLQEFKCMDIPEYIPLAEPGEPSGTILVRWPSRAQLISSPSQFIGNLVHASEIPGWLLTEPTDKFVSYEVFISTYQYGRHNATYHNPIISGPAYLPQTVRIALNQVIFMKHGKHHFQRYIHKPNARISINSHECVYIAVQGTRNIQYVRIKQECYDYKVQTKKT